MKRVIVVGDEKKMKTRLMIGTELRFFVVASRRLSDSFIPGRSKFEFRNGCTNCAPPGHCDGKRTLWKIYNMPVSLLKLVCRWNAYLNASGMPECDLGKLRVIPSLSFSLNCRSSLEGSRHMRHIKINVHTFRHHAVFMGG